MKKLIICVVFILTGCANSPIRVSMMSEEALKDVPSPSLCNTYSMYGNDKVKVELKRRGEIAAEDWYLIDNNKIGIGMGELALVCLKGFPGNFGGINTSTGSWGTQKQWVYRPCGGCGAHYVYTKNGKVTSWQF